MDAERAFSRGRLTVSRLRRSLSDESVRANTILGSWARIADLVPKKELVDFLAGKKGTHTREKAAQADDGEDTGVGEVPSSTVEEVVDGNDDLYT